MLFYGKSDIGKVRKTNEDSYICGPPSIFMVADGMGGHAAGEIASNLCTKTISQHLFGIPETANWQDALRQAIICANNIIYQEANAKSEYFGMGTTITAVYLDGNKVHWGHVGDSRLYLIRDEKLHQVTEDHSVVWELVKKGTINNAQALTHPNRNILTRAVGTDKDIIVDTGTITWQGSDKLLLCSDGLTNMLLEDELLQIINSQTAPQDTKGIESIVNQLITQANAAGGVDNITAVLLARAEK